MGHGLYGMPLNLTLRTHGKPTVEVYLPRDALPLDAGGFLGGLRSF